jgi:hypothetical protein
MAARAQREETPSESASSRDDDAGEDEVEEDGEKFSSPRSPPLPLNLPSLGDLFNQQEGISVGTHRMKHPQMDTEGVSGLLLQFGLTLVYSDLQGTHFCIGGGKEKLTYSESCRFCHLRQPLGPLRP